MLKRQGKGLVTVLMFFAAPAMGQTVFFDFNDLGPFAGPNDISDYMSDIYGSNVDVGGARATNDNTDPSGGLGDPVDRMIATSFQLFNRGDFEVLFEDAPIFGVEFEGHVLDPTPGADFRFSAFNGDDLVFELTHNEAEEAFDSGLILFGGPVDRLHFSNSGRHDVGIDDLSVVVPEPTTALLILAGSASLLRRRSRA